MDKEELVDVRIPAPSPDEGSDDDEKVAEDLLLEGKRRDSIPGLKPSPTVCQESIYFPDILLIGKLRNVLSRQNLKILRL